MTPLTEPVMVSISSGREKPTPPSRDRDADDGGGHVRTGGDCEAIAPMSARAHPSQA